MSLSPVHHVALSVSNLEKSVAFYRDVLGYRKTLEQPVERPEYRTYLRLAPGVSGRMAMMQADDRTLGQIELLEFSPPMERTTPPKRPGDPGMFMIAIEVVGESLADVRDRLVAWGTDFWSEITTVSFDDYGDFKVVMIEDPDGVLIELVELPSPEEVRRVRLALKQRQAAAAT